MLRLVRPQTATEAKNYAKRTEPAYGRDGSLLMNPIDLCSAIEQACRRRTRASQQLLNGCYLVVS